MQSTIAKTRFAPTMIAPETFVIWNHQGEGTMPFSVPLNTMVIRAAEPVVIDTGVADNRDQYLADVFSVVEPADIRWIYISHDDIDHTGNLNDLVALAPNATVVATWFMWERMGAALDVPLGRQRWIADGESFDVGDRRLHAVRPPVFDSPTTRGLFDPRTGVYWTSDTFATAMVTPTTDADEIEAEVWEGAIPTFARYVSPWLEMVDDARYQRSVDRVQALGATTAVGCHTPVLRGERLARAFELTRQAPTAVIDPEPGQELLDELTVILGGGVAA